MHVAPSLTTAETSPSPPPLPRLRSRTSSAEETGAINKSLFTLAKVISVLSDMALQHDSADQRQHHVPYRDSTLTKLLADALGGNALALFIACVSPALAQADETTNTLSFASKAKNIHNRPVVQSEQTGVSILQQMQQTIRALQDENASLRTRIAAPPPQPPPSAPPPPSQALPPQPPAPPQQSNGDGGVAAFLAANGAIAPAEAPRKKVGISALREAEDPKTVDLRQEVSTLRAENDELKRSKATLAKENAQLRTKLERLELVFESQGQ